ncbi:hypothetical protein BDZ89DRAFT_1161212 [Hymenopellis radicata]|nr:hypothetical protein BDZ89DRAFT_1161212 [Hymenopellis radicata]
MPSPEQLTASSLLSPETVTEIVRTSRVVYTSHADFLKDCRRWREDCKKQSRDPIGEGIRLQASFDIPLKKCLSPLELPSGFRQPLPLLGRGADQSAGTFVGNLTLGKCLRVNERGKPDMWTADLVEADNEAGKGSAQRVVLKIAQQSSQDIPEFEATLDPSKVKVLRAINLVAGEFFIYERLGHLQGWLLPYSFGLHKITMSNNEDAYIFITEYIEGRNLRTWKEDNAHPEHPAPVPPILTNYFEKGITMIPLFVDLLAVLHANGIVHMGLYHSPEHVILVEDCETAAVTGVVFVEFKMAATKDSISGGTTMSKLMDFETMSVLSHVTDCCPTHRRMFGKWMQAEKMVAPQHLFSGVDLSD